MEHDGGSAHTGTRLLSWVTTLALWGLVALTAVMVVMCGVVISGRGTVTVDTVLTGPYTVGLEDDLNRSITVSDTGHIAAYTNFEIGHEARYFTTAPTVVAPVVLDRQDTDSRAVGVTSVLLLLALAWVFLLSARGIVHSARGCDPLDPRNVSRFRRMAAVTLAARLVPAVGEILLTRTLDLDVPATVSLTHIGWLPVIAAVLALLALSEVFRVGSGLRAFERATI